MEIKSVMHDATPSWNGFNYQGKVGIYVCLSMILDQLKSHDKDSVEFTQYLNEHAIQYEWIEDFSILQNGTYISHHQVKHKAGTAFSTHLDALITIRNRNKKILSSRDLNKYFTAENDVDDSGEKLDTNKQMEHIKFLIELGCLSEEGILSSNWKEQIDKSNDYYPCLSEFEEFSQNAFDNAIVYFHTAENVSRPTKVISEYEEIKAHAHLRSDFEDKRELVDLKQLNIHIGKSNNSLFDLVLSDADLEKTLLI